MRNLVKHFFGRKTSSVYQEASSKNLQSNEISDFKEMFIVERDLNNPNQNYLRLKNGFHRVFTQSVRNELASHEECFFIKSHEKPFKRYFLGEFTIHIVRHPGAVFWSYYNWLLQKDPSRIESIADVIDGKVFAGSWSIHTEAWLSAADRLGDRYYSIRYEDINRKQSDLLDYISDVSGLEIRDASSTFPSFSHFQERDPRVFRSGKVDEWREKVNNHQIERIFEVHGKTMQKVGYHI